MGTPDLEAVLSALGAVTEAAGPEDLGAAILSCVLTAAAVDSAAVFEPDSVDPDVWSNWTWPVGFLSAQQAVLFERLHRAEPWVLAVHTRQHEGCPLRISDRLSQRQYRGLVIYSELFRHLEIDHQVAFSLPNGSSRPTCVALSRRGRDFSDTEMQRLATLCRPLASAARAARAAQPASAVACPDRLALSHRESDVLSLVAAGFSSLQIGRRLGISVRTVDKHLEHVFAKTGARNRTEAAVRWLADGRSAETAGDPERYLRENAYRGRARSASG